MKNGVRKIDAVFIDDDILSSYEATYNVSSLSIFECKPELCLGNFLIYLKKCANQEEGNSSVLSGPRASRSVLCSSHTFKFITDDVNYTFSQSH